jgi:DNA-binding transcriptional regulator YiaG
VKQKPNSIKDMRQALGLNQSQFWGRVHITQSGGSRYEGGRTLPRPIGVLIQIAYGTKAEANAVVAGLRKANK